MDWLLDSRLRVFQTTARLMSFTDAASQVGITQPAVSFQIRSLETALGASLFRRSSSGLELTELGDALYRKTQVLFMQAQQIENEIVGLTGVVSGTLSVAASMVMSNYILPATIKSFISRDYKCMIKVQMGNSREILDQVSDGAVDVGMVSDPVDRRDIAVERFFEDEVVLITPASHRWAKQAGLSLADLAEEPFIMRESGSGTRKILESNLKRAKVSPKQLNVVATLSGFESVKAAVMEGIGVAVVPRIGVAGDAREGRLAIVPFTNASMRRGFNLVYAKQTPLPERVARFLECAREAAAIRQPENAVGV